MSNLKTEKTQEPTPHRREQMRRSGPVVRSTDLVAATIGLGMFAGLFYWGPGPAFRLGETLRNYLSADLWQTVPVEQWTWHMPPLAQVLASVALPLILGALVLSILSQISQGGVRWQPERIRPDFARLHPARQIAQFSDIGRWTSVLAGTAKTLMTGFLIGGCLWLERDQVIGLSGLEARSLAVALPQVAIRCGLFAALVLCGLGLVDYALRRWRQEQALRMSPEEIREENKARDGNPQLHTRRREMHRSYAAPRVGEE